MNPTAPLQPVERETAVRVATELGLTLPEETELRSILQAGVEKYRAQRWQSSLIRAWGRPWTSLGTRRAFKDRPKEQQTTYYLSYPTDQATEPTGVAMVQPWWDHIRAVARAPAPRRWVFAGTAGGPFLLDTENSMRKEVVDRATAAQVSLRVYEVPLPTEEEIARICDAAIAKKPRLSPPA